MLALIPGLGCDYRVLEYLRLRERHQRVLTYLPPERPDEPLPDYAARMAWQIDDPTTAVLVGLSFGGMVAIEMAKRLPIRRVIIVSSIKTQLELPPQLQALRAVPLHRWLPGGVLKWLNQATADFFFGVRTTDESRLLAQIVQDTDPAFLEWAVDQVVNWENLTVPHGLRHIHGTEDRIFPSESIERAFWVHGGSHFMVVQQAAEVSALINQQIEDLY